MRPRVSDEIDSPQPSLSPSPVQPTGELLGSPTRVRSLLAVPESLRGAATTPAAAAVVGVALIAVMIAVVILGRWWWQENDSREQRIPPPTAASSAVGGEAASGLADVTPAGEGGQASGAGAVDAGSPASTPSSDAAGGAAPPGSPVVVHVAGKVRKPGVVTLSAEARVVDAVQGAGGLAPGADPATVNLARPVVDGEQIVVLGKGEAAHPAAAAAAAPAPSAAPVGGGVPAAGAGKIDLNRADQAQLETLPGVGPVLAGRIIEWRTRHGRFSSVDELGEVSGVGEKTFARLAPLVTV